MDTILYENRNFTLSEELNGPVVAVLFSIEVSVALVANLLVLLVTLYNYKVLKQPAVIFLTNFVIGNLIMTILYMCPIIITAAAGEWIFGRTLKQKEATCQFFGFFFMNNIFLTSLTLAVISVDRFLFIVKPWIHKRFMTTKVAVIISIGLWLLSGFLSTGPFYGLGMYAFDNWSATCVTEWIGHLDFVLYAFFIVLLCIVIIVVTTVWTFCFTRSFIQRLDASTNYDNKHHVYNSRMKKVVGIFGALLFVIMLSYLPIIVFGVFFIVTDGLVDWPGEINTALNMIFSLNYVLNPIVQSYFRKEVKSVIVNFCKKIGWCRKQETMATSHTDMTVL